MRRLPFVALLFAIVSLIASIAHAQQPESDAKVTARTLFHQARNLMETESYTEACPKFEESLRLDPSAAGTLLNLAICHLKVGKTATAWVELEQSLRLARMQDRDDRVALAEEQLAIVSPLLSRLTIVVEPTAAAQEPRVFRDGVQLGRAVWGEAIPVDPGDHVVRIEAKGFAPRTQTINILPNGSSTTFTVIPLEPTPDPPPASSGAPIENERARPRTSSSSQRSLAWIAGGTGAVLTISSLVFGGLALDASSRAENGCVLDRCGGDAVELSDRSKTFADVATVTGIVGVVALATSVVLFLTSAPSNTLRSSKGRSIAW